MRVVVTSAGTGFGPTAALGYFVQWAKAQPDLDVVLDIPEPALPLVTRCLPERWRSVTRPNHVAAPPLDLDGCLLVNFGRAELLDHESTWNAHLFVDCVGWLNVSGCANRLRWREARTTALVEFFPPLHEADVSDGVQLIRPCVIAEPVRADGDGGYVLVSLGGGIFPGTPVGNPLLPVARAIAATAMAERFPLPLRFSGGAAGSDLVRLYPLEEHRQLVRGARLVITVPGLYTVFEAVQAGKPLLLLPPTNYTQLVQYVWYRAHGLVPPALDWLEHCHFPTAEPVAIPMEQETRFTAELRRVIACEASAAIGRRIIHCATDMLERQGESRRAGAALARTYLGADLPALESIVHEFIA